MDDVGRQDPRGAESLRSSAATLARTVGEAKDSAERRTRLAADRTILAAERTDGGLGSHRPGGAGERGRGQGAVGRCHPAWLAPPGGTLLVVFSMVCFAAAVWRELDRGAPPRRPDMRRLPRSLLVGLNGFLIAVDLAVLVGLWLGPER